MNLARLLSRCKPVAKINSTSSSSSSSIACTSFFLPGQRRSYTSSSTLATTAEFVSAVTFLPHPDKGEHGEDAYFITDNNQVAGVADGVGGWVEMGIDAGAFSRELMGGAEKFAINENSLDPYAMLNSAYFSTTALGTCTACIIALDGKELRAINVGDSGFSILRRQTESHKDKNELNDDPPHWALFFQTTEQVHFFNCPMQLGTNSKDSPSDGQQFNLPMEHGDIVILATDGLIDNLFTAELIQMMHTFEYDWCIENQLEPTLDSFNDMWQDKAAITAFANHLGARTQELAHDAVRRSPFTVNAATAGYTHVGGKLDDITCIVAAVNCSE